MYVNNINQILKANGPQKIKLSEGNVINGKVLSNEKGKGAIKLYDGTIIPAIFLSENDVDQEKYIKFYIQSFDGENYVLKMLNENDEDTSTNEKSLSNIISDLNIPYEEGKDIVMSLIKYNLPATNENINLIYKNITFLNTIKNMPDSEIILLLNKYLGKEIDENSKEFKLTKEIFSKLKNVDKNFLSFMLENDIPHDITNMLKTQEFMKNKFYFNSLIDNVKNSMADINKNIEDTIHEPITNKNLNSEESVTNLSSNISDSYEIKEEINKQISYKPIAIIAFENNGVEKLTIPQENKGVSLPKILDSINKTITEIENYNQPLTDTEIEIKNLLADFSSSISTLLKDDDSSLSYSFPSFNLNKKDSINFENSNTNNRINTIATPVNENENSESLSFVKTTPDNSFNKNMILKNILTTFLEGSTSILAKANRVTFPLNNSLNKTLQEENLCNKSLTYSLGSITNDVQSLLSEITMNEGGNDTDSINTINIQGKDFQGTSESEPQNIRKELPSPSIKQETNSIHNSDKEIKPSDNKAQPLNIDKENRSISSKLPDAAYKKTIGQDKLIIDTLVNQISKALGGNKNITVFTLEEAVNTFKNNKEHFVFSSPEAFNKLLDNMDIYKQINDNYSLYFFNTYNDSNIYKNNIIIKNKYKGSKHIDINDVKAFISVDTNNLGTIEGNLYKKNDDISIAFSVNKDYVDFVKNNIKTLKDSLKEFGYNIINISVQTLDKEKNLLPFSDFFDESILRELDVKV